MIEDKNQYLDVNVLADLHRYMVELDGQVRALEAALHQVLAIVSSLSPGYKKLIDDQLCRLAKSVLEGQETDAISEVKRHAMSKKLISIAEVIEGYREPFAVIEGGRTPPEAD